MAQAKRRSNTQQSTPTSKSRNASNINGGHAAAHKASRSKPERNKSVPSEANESAEESAFGAYPRFDMSTRDQIAGIILAVLGISMLIAVLTPTTGVISQTISTWLHLAFGVGAFLIPITLIVWAVMFFMPERHIIPLHVAIGLGLIALAIMGLMGITTPNADNPQIGAQILFNQEYALPERGGYLGNGLAWLLLTLVGKVAGIVILIGLIIAGLFIIGLDVRKLVEAIRERHERAREEARLREQKRANRRAQSMASNRFSQTDVSLPQDYAPTALFNPNKPLSGYQNTPVAPTRPMSGTLYPDGSFVPLEAVNVPSYLLQKQGAQNLPTTFMPEIDARNPISVSCGDEPWLGMYASPEALRKTTTFEDEAPLYAEEADESFENDEDEIEEYDEVGQTKGIPKHLQRRIDDAQFWWDPKDDLKRDTFDPDEPMRDDSNLPGVLPGAPVLFEEDLDNSEKSGFVLTGSTIESINNAANLQMNESKAVSSKIKASAIEQQYEDTSLPWVKPSQTSVKNDAPKKIETAKGFNETRTVKNTDIAPKSEYKLPDPNCLNRSQNGLVKSREEQRET
ncbi:MAG: DNA translocase FtsK 4TM domain-containing protein [Coriobacteriales bacterium]|nr:DNA translocase FtsK 4TM domain-containing protein [Coriobacteriales bacterium]